MHVNELEYTHQNILNMWNTDHKPQKTKNESKLLKIILTCYSVTMIMAALLILSLYENILSLNIYIIYIAAGVLLGLGAIILIHLFSKPNKGIDI